MAAKKTNPTNHLLPSEFLRSLGFTHGAWLAFLGEIKFPLERMDAMDKGNEIYLGGEDPAGFYHPQIIGRPGYNAWWHPIFETADGERFEPLWFVSTPKGYGMKVVVKNKCRKTYLFDDLMKRKVRPVFDPKIHTNLMLREGALLPSVSCV